MTRVNFFLEGIKRIKTTGTITRSSRFVSEEMCSHIDFSTARCIVELGAGDGVITRHLLRRAAPDCKVFAFEILAKFCEELRQINDPRLVVIEDSAEHIGRYLSAHGVEHADAVVSALPFVALPEKLGDAILNEAHEVLRPGGKFVQLNYSLIARKRYERVFGESNIHFVLPNIPPAFVTVCLKR